MVETLRFTRGNLPHWLVSDHAYFVTIRLAGTIPKPVLAELQTERDALAKVRANEESLTELARQQFLRVERCLHAVDNSRNWLTRRRIPEIVLSNLDWIEQQCGWQVYAATVQANHVHLLLRNNEGRSAGLLKDLGQYKNYVARQINQVLGRTGAFWAREGFDHWCRDEAKVISVARYICDNPVKAGLVKTWADWPWTRCVEWLRPTQSAAGS
jgi:REP element-mobilizing transposase RayT